MRTHLVSRGLASACLAAALLLGGTAARAADELLTVTQDESSMERTIARYLADKHDLKIDERTEKDDLILQLTMEEKDLPKFKIEIDTQDVNRDKETKAVVERAVLVNVYTGVFVPENKRAEVLPVLNAFVRETLFAGFYIDTDGEIINCWAVNVMKEGLHPEYVYDVVARVDKNWQKLYPDIKKIL